MPTSTPTSIRLQITFEAPPPATHDGHPAEFGLQDKQQALSPGALMPDGALRFECEVGMKPSAADGAPDWGGAYVHGPAGARFLYLSWRQVDGAWFKRFKIPLAPMSWEQVAAAQAGALAVRVSAARSGTVAPLGAGWVVENDA